MSSACIHVIYVCLSQLTAIPQNCIIPQARILSRTCSGSERIQWVHASRSIIYESCMCHMVPQAQTIALTVICGTSTARDRNTCKAHLRCFLPFVLLLHIHAEANHSETKEAETARLGTLIQFVDVAEQVQAKEATKENAHQCRPYSYPVAVELVLIC